MSTDPEFEEEVQHIRSIYAARDKEHKRSLYSWELSDVRYSDAIKMRILSQALRRTVGSDLSDLKVLDVGCGTGGFLRTLIEWGAYPHNLVGTEFLEDRLQKAAEISPLGVDWHLGDLDFDNDSLFDLVSAHTVFTSILKDEDRASLAQDMWQKVKPGGWIMIFDFRYNNPLNPNVKKLTRNEMMKWWPSKTVYYTTGLLVPPLARRFIGNNYLLAEFLTLVFPFLRSHFIYSVLVH
jgi:SAM-dependent methyltransferase